jgi:hypothetical protein
VRASKRPRRSAPAEIETLLIADFVGRKATKGIDRAIAPAKNAANATRRADYRQALATAGGNPGVAQLAQAAHQRLGD